MATRKTKAKTPKARAKTTKPKAPSKKKDPEGLPEGVDGRTAQKVKELEAAKRRPEVHRLRLKGFSTRQIAKQFGVSHQTICKDLNIFRRALDAETKELAGDLKAQEEERRIVEDERLDDQLLLIHGVLHPDTEKSSNRRKLVMELQACVQSGTKGAERTRLFTQLGAIAEEGKRPTIKQVMAAIEALGKVTDRRCRLWGLNGSVKLEKIPPRGNFRERVLGALGEVDAAEMLLALALGEEPSEV